MQEVAGGSDDLGSYVRSFRARGAVRVGHTWLCWRHIMSKKVKVGVHCSAPPAPFLVGAAIRRTWSGPAPVLHRRRQRLCCIGCRSGHGLLRPHRGEQTRGNLEFSFLENAQQRSWERVGVDLDQRLLKQLRQVERQHCLHAATAKQRMDA